VFSSWQIIFFNSDSLSFGGLGKGAIGNSSNDCSLTIIGGVRALSSNRVNNDCTAFSGGLGIEYFRLSPKNKYDICKNN